MEELGEPGSASEHEKLKKTVLGLHVHTGGLLNLEGKDRWKKDLHVGPCLNKYQHSCLRICPRIVTPAEVFMESAMVRGVLTLPPRAGHTSETCLCLDWGSSGQFIAAAVFSRAENISQGLNFLLREREN